MLIKCKKIKFESEYETFSLINIVILFGAIGIPYFASSLNTSRLYHISLMFLAPFCVIGGITVFRVICKTAKVSWTKQHVKSSLKILSVFFAILLLFNTKFVFVVANDHPMSISLGQEAVKQYGDLNDINSFYSQYHPEEEIFGVKWLSKYRNDELRIYADRSQVYNKLTSYIMPKQFGLYVLRNTTKVPEDSYIYLGYANVNYGLMFKYAPRAGERVLYNITEISSLFNESGTIYSNGGAQVYHR